MSRLVERLVGRPLTDEEKLTAGIVFTLTFMVFEGAFAIVAGSLAMLGLRCFLALQTLTVS